MGYTHYFAYEPQSDQFKRAWAAIADDACLIARHVQEELGVELAGGLGQGPPQIDGRRIWLNGPAAGDRGHETFLIDPTPWLVWEEQEALGHSDWAARERREFGDCGFVAGFCKTARKPYDIAVTSILLRACHLAPDAFIAGSDGDWLHEWQHGANHWDESCPRGVSPVQVVGELFGQSAVPANDPLVANVWDGPRMAQPGDGELPPATAANRRGAKDAH